MLARVDAPGMPLLESESENGPVRALSRRHKGARRFMLTTFSADERKALCEKIYRLGGTVIEEQAYNQSTSHVVASKPTRSEKFLAACASGKWVMRPEFIYESARQSKWLDEEDYEWAPSPQLMAHNAPPLVNAPRRWRQHVRSWGLAFRGWRALVFVPDSVRAEAYKRLLRAGGAVIVVLQRQFLKKSNILHSRITHVFVSEPEWKDCIRVVQAAGLVALHPDYIHEFLAKDDPPLKERFNIREYPAKNGSSSSQASSSQKTGPSYHKSSSAKSSQVGKSPGLSNGHRALSSQVKKEPGLSSDDCKPCLDGLARSMSSPPSKRKILLSVSDEEADSDVEVIGAVAGTTKRIASIKPPAKMPLNRMAGTSPTRSGLVLSLCHRALSSHTATPARSPKESLHKSPMKAVQSSINDFTVRSPCKRSLENVVEHRGPPAKRRDVGEQQQAVFSNREIPVKHQVAAPAKSTQFLPGKVSLSAKVTVSGRQQKGEIVQMSAKRSLFGDDADADREVSSLLRHSLQNGSLSTSCSERRSPRLAERGQKSKLAGRFGADCGYSCLSNDNTSLARPLLMLGQNSSKESREERSPLQAQQMVNCVPGRRSPRLAEQKLRNNSALTPQGSLKKHNSMSSLYPNRTASPKKTLQQTTSCPPKNFVSSPLERNILPAGEADSAGGAKSPQTSRQFTPKKIRLGASGLAATASHMQAFALTSSEKENPITVELVRSSSDAKSHSSDSSGPVESSMQNGDLRLCSGHLTELSSNSDLARQRRASIGERASDSLLSRSSAFEKVKHLLQSTPSKSPGEGSPKISPINLKCPRVVLVRHSRPSTPVSSGQSSQSVGEWTPSSQFNFSARRNCPGLPLTKDTRHWMLNEPTLSLPLDLPDRAVQARWCDGLRDHWEDVVRASVLESLADTSTWSVNLFKSLSAPGYFPSLTMMRQILHVCLLKGDDVSVTLAAYHFFSRLLLCYPPSRERDADTYLQALGDGSSSPSDTVLDILERPAETLREQLAQNYVVALLLGKDSNVNEHSNRSIPFLRRLFWPREQCKEMTVYIRRLLSSLVKAVDSYSSQQESSEKAEHLHVLKRLLAAVADCWETSGKSAGGSHTSRNLLVEELRLSWGSFTDNSAFVQCLLRGLRPLWLKEKVLCGLIGSAIGSPDLAELRLPSLVSLAGQLIESCGRVRDDSPDKPSHTPYQSLKPNAQINKRNGRGETSLQRACIRGDETAVLDLLGRGADPNTQCHAGWTPLHEAANHGHTACVKALLSAGPSLEPGLGVYLLAAPQGGVTPLHDAAGNGNYDVCRLLVEAGGPVLLHQKTTAGRIPYDEVPTNHSQRQDLLALLDPNRGGLGSVSAKKTNWQPGSASKGGILFTEAVATALCVGDCDDDASDAARLLPDKVRDLLEQYHRLLGYGGSARLACLEMLC